jgi:hypothetical protein
VGHCPISFGIDEQDVLAVEARLELNRTGVSISEPKERSTNSRPKAVRAPLVARSGSVVGGAASPGFLLAPVPWCGPTGHPGAGSKRCCEWPSSPRSRPLAVVTGRRAATFS